MNSAQQSRLATALRLPYMDDILLHAPSVTGLLVRAVTATGNRWDAYSCLKASASLLVGWYAVCPYLQASCYHDALMQAFDYLLPDDGRESRESEREGVA